jgi:hypothetical protein
MTAALGVHRAAALVLATAVRVFFSAAAGARLSVTGNLIDRNNPLCLFWILIRSRSGRKTLPSPASTMVAQAAHCARRTGAFS